MDIQEAFKLRKEITSKDSSMSYGERRVLVSIILGDYDRYKEEAVKIANEDLIFLNKEHEDN